jgi:hypothetical protein
MASARTTVLLVAALLALEALACSVSADLGGDESPTEAPTGIPPADSEVVKVSLLDEKGEAHVPAGSTVTKMASWTSSLGPGRIRCGSSWETEGLRLRLAVRRLSRGAALPEAVRVALPLTRQCQ